MVVAGIVAKHGVSGLFLCTMMAGVMLVIMGLTGLGKAVQFIPRPVVMGFTNGIAVLIASTQIRDFFGLRLEHNPGEFFARMRELIGHAATISLPATALSVVSLIIILVTPRITKRIPGYIVALVAGTVGAVLLHLPVETIGTRFGGIPSGLPHLQIPEFHSGLILPLFSSAVTIAMLGAIESLMSAVVADSMSGDKHNPNVELVAQGVANIVSPIFGGCRPPAPSRAPPPTSAAARALRWRASSTPSRCWRFSYLPRHWRAIFPWPCWPPSSWWSATTWDSGRRRCACCSSPSPRLRCGWSPSGSP